MAAFGIGMAVLDLASQLPALHFGGRNFVQTRIRDRSNRVQLNEQGWRVMIVWECALVGRHAPPSTQIAERVQSWLEGIDTYGEVSGNLSGLSLRGL